MLKPAIVFFLRANKDLQVSHPLEEYGTISYILSFGRPLWMAYIAKWVARISNSKYRPSAERDRGSSEQEVRCEALPTQDQPMPHETIPAVNHEKTRRQVLVV